MYSYIIGSMSNFEEWGRFFWGRNTDSYNRAITASTVQKTLQISIDIGIRRQGAREIGELILFGDSNGHAALIKSNLFHAHASCAACYATQHTNCDPLLIKGSCDLHFDRDII